MVFAFAGIIALFAGAGLSYGLLNGSWRQGLLVTAPSILVWLGSLWWWLRALSRADELVLSIDEESDAAVAESTGIAEIDAIVSKLMSSLQMLRDQEAEDKSSITDTSAAKLAQASLALHDNLISIQERNENYAQLSKSLAELSSVVDSVSDNTDQASEAANNANRQALESKGTILGSMDCIEKLTSDFDESVRVIENLAADSHKISHVVNVIRDITDQTNLLALNAAIEAARAGEQGRGFAVVADEVRKLAQNTQDSTQEIRQMIEALQSGVNEAVTAINESRTVAEQGQSKAKQAVTDIEALTGEIGALAELGERISMGCGMQNMLTKSAVAKMREMENSNQETIESIRAAEQICTSL